MMNKNDIRAYSFIALNDFISFQKVFELQKELKIKFGLNEEQSHFMQVPTKYINLFLFSIFGQFSQTSKDPYKDVYNKIAKADRKVFNNVLNTNEFKFMKDQKDQKDTAGKISIKKLQREGNSVQKNLPSLQKGIQFFNFTTPRSLSSKYSSALFKLQNFDKDWLNSQQDQVLKQIIVIPVEQTQQVTILCFFTLKKPEKSKQIILFVDKVLKSNNKSRFSSPKKQSPNKPGSSNKKSNIISPAKQQEQQLLQTSSKKGKKKSKKTEQQKQSPKKKQNNQNQSQGLNDKYQCLPFWKDGVSIVWTLILMMLISLIAQSLGTGYAAMDRSPQNLNIMEKHLILGKQQFDEFVIRPIGDWLNNIMCQQC